jgi:hypothetical protein
MSIPRLLQIIREEGAVFNREYFYLGEVESSSPLKIKTNGIILDSDQLKIINNQTFNLNDTVLLIKVSAFFIVIGKVVSA